jgi:hypothetical protein
LAKVFNIIIKGLPKDDKNYSYEKTLGPWILFDAIIAQNKNSKNKRRNEYGNMIMCAKEEGEKFCETGFNIWDILKLIIVNSMGSKSIP